MEKIRNIFIVFFGIIILFAIIGRVNATEVKTTNIEKDLSKSIDENNLTKEDILKIYDEISEEYSNEEILKIIEENRGELKEQGISDEVIEAGRKILETTNRDEIRNIIENDLDIESIGKKIEEGKSFDEILKEVITEKPVEKTLSVILKMIWANKIVKISAVVLLIIIIYKKIILRWIIYRKAKKHGWAAIVPLYRQITMYKVCNLSPFLMLFWLLPIIGWFIMLVIAVMKRFYLAKSFEKGALFGFGLLFFPIIFQSIIAFNKNITHVGEIY